jgi:hypothetical protein
MDLSRKRKITKYPGAVDKTGYAKAVGYQGEKPVMVLDGRVVSHRSKCWFDFLDGVRKDASKK